MKKRARDLGLLCPGSTGGYNAITDLPGISIGFSTINSAEGDAPKIQTGVTAIYPKDVDDNPVYV